MEKQNMTDQEIAEIFAKNIHNKKFDAINILIDKYLGNISKDENDINFICKYNFYNELLKTPKNYARWCILLAIDFIYDYQRKYMSFVSYNIKRQKNYVEFNFEVFKGDYNNDSINISIILTNNGIISDINNEFVSISKERNKNNFTGKWNANLSENLAGILPLADNKKLGLNKNKNLEYIY